MAHSLDADALFGSLARRAHAPCAETAGLQHADREDVGQDSLLLQWRRLKAPGCAADIEVVDQAFGGVLRNEGRNAKRRSAVRARVKSMSAQELDALAAPAVEAPEDWVDALTPRQRTCLEGFESAASDEELARLWRVDRTTVSRRRSLLVQRITRGGNRKSPREED